MIAEDHRSNAPCLSASDIDRIEAAHNKQSLKRERWRRFCAIRDYQARGCKRCLGSGKGSLAKFEEDEDAPLELMDCMWCKGTGERTK